jgi:hypothetical protein
MRRQPRDVVLPRNTVVFAQIARGQPRRLPSSNGSRWRSVDARSVSDTGLGNSRRLLGISDGKSRPLSTATVM